MQGFILQTFINFEKCKLMPFKGCAETPWLEFFHFLNANCNNKQQQKQEQ